MDLDLSKTMLTLRQRPNRQHVMYQTWRNLLFLHWEIAPAQIQATLPKGLTVHTYEGKAYVGLVPFFMDNIRPRFLPAVPWVSYFLETNVRTYVVDGNGTPGVWFYSLDANQPLAVHVARTFFKLPYFHAKMTAPIQNEQVNYSTQRRGETADSNFVYEGKGNVREAEIGSLEFFLAERYILFAETHRGLAQGHVHHTPYPLQDVTVTNYDATLLKLAGFDVGDRPFDHALMSKGVDVDVFALQCIHQS